MIAFLLVEPEIDENLGACARALYNFGFEKLILVNPKADPESKAAKALAHGSESILNNAITLGSFEAAIKDQHLVIGTSQRPRKASEPLLQINELIKNHLQSESQDVCFVFGPESKGLTNEQLSHCNFICRIPTERSQPSLNLSQAVMIIAYELFQAKNMKALFKWDMAHQAEIARLSNEFTGLLQQTHFPAANTINDFTDILFRSLKRAKLEKRDVNAWMKLLKHLKTNFAIKNK